MQPDFKRSHAKYANPRSKSAATNVGMPSIFLFRLEIYKLTKNAALNPMSYHPDIERGYRIFNRPWGTWVMTFCSMPEFIYEESVMQCPVCKDPQLVISERQGIEIDYCPSCRGVWLDRGELDKLIERSAVSAAPAQLPKQPYRQESTPYGDSRPGHYKKHKSWLSDIFD